MRCLSFILFTSCLVGQSQNELILQHQKDLAQHKVDQAAIARQLSIDKDIKDLAAKNAEHSAVAEAQRLATLKTIDDVKKTTESNKKLESKETSTLTTLTQYNTIVLGLAAVLAGIFSPMLMAWLTNRNARRIKIEDWERQDQIAQRLLDRQAISEKKAEIVNNRIVEIAKVQVAKVEQIHTLVNSNLTASMQVQLDFAKAGLTSLEEILTLKQQQGVAPEQKTLANIELTKSKIGELEAQLRERLKATSVAEKNIRGDIKAAKDPESPLDPAAAAVLQANRIEDVGLDTNKDVKILKDRVATVEIVQDKKRDKD